MKKTSKLDFLWYALYAFAGLGIEMLLLAVVEPILFGLVKTNEYTSTQTIIHWVLTIFCWAAMAVWLILDAKKTYGFSILVDTKCSTRQLFICCALVVGCIVLNIFDWGTLKIIGEFHKKGLLLFAFQYLYYLFEMILVLLIIIFGQHFVESLLKKQSNLPWGGLILCLTWGAIHMLSKGSITTGLGVMAFSLAYGEMYLLLSKNAKYTYIAIVIAFII